MTYTLLHADALDALRELPDNSVDSIVTDPPYGLGSASPAQIADTVVAWMTGDRTAAPGGAGFMGKAWDAFVPPPAIWDEALRVLKPGGHLLAFAGSRTQDLMGLSIRLAGFEIRDSIAWLYGSGFPKSHNISKAIDKAAGATRAVVGLHPQPAGNKPGGSSLNMSANGMPHTANLTAPATPEAAHWDGWGTALKPAHEPIIMARKPFTGTVAQNVLAHGTGAVNIDGSRIGTETRTQEQATSMGLLDRSSMPHTDAAKTVTVTGRHPANVILDEYAAGLVDQQSGVSVSKRAEFGAGYTSDTLYKADRTGVVAGAEFTSARGHNDSGGASRFFYIAKAPKRERPVVDGVAHPTVKPLSLMRHLVTLVTPPGGTVLEPFAGSGTTVEAALIEGFNVIAIERDADYIPLIRARIARTEGWEAA